MSLLKLIGGPGSISFLIVCLAAGILLRQVRRQHARAVHRYLLVVVGVYIVLALPPVAATIADSLPNHPSIALPSEVGHVDSLVIFDGDNRRGRARAAIALVQRDRPATTWVLGNGWLVEPMVRAGIPRDDIRHRGFMATTRDQMVELGRIIAASPGSRVGILVSRLQAARVARMADQQHMNNAVVIAAPADVEPPVNGWLYYFPTYSALRLSRDAIYEHVALWYYARRGWTAP